MQPDGTTSGTRPAETRAHPVSGPGSMASSHRLRISQIESLTSDVVELYLGRALLPIGVANGGDSPMHSAVQCDGLVL
eukprot:m.239059 g.239059  ORF g.239059 m.239059 type:complete len:78 (-) comp26248_c0_seq4:70-303(-)